MMENSKKRRIYGEHITSIKIFEKYILPDLKNDIHNYRWVDLFCGEGNLILPILNLIPKNKRIEFFEKNIFLFDIQDEMIEKAIFNAGKYGIPEEIARKNIFKRDTIENYPTFILNHDIPIYHITNPPYLYLGYMKKCKETKKYLKYFQKENKNYQDLYQLAMMNDLRNGIEKMIYIIPSNFLFGFSVSNRIRKDFLQYYTIEKAIIFEKKIFEFTGTNVVISFFERKKTQRKEKIIFEGTKIGKQIQKKTYVLKPENCFKAGNEFEEFVKQYKFTNSLKVSFYLTIEELMNNPGNKKILILDANNFNGKTYETKTIYVNDSVHEKIKSNILFIKTIDSGHKERKAGLYEIREIFNVDGIVVTKAKYRTHPIQLFFNPEISENDQLLLKKYFNLVLEFFRKKTDSEFMTTYKYSDSDYTRKYLGLSQAKKLIETFPILYLKENEINEFKKIIENENVKDIIDFVRKKHDEIKRKY